VARTWLSITVELIEGRGRSFWPRPGRVLAAARTHTFSDLATAIDDAFARWDRSHLHEFLLADDIRIGQPDDEWGEGGDVLDDEVTKLSRLGAGEQFVYVFDFGDDWHHLCTVGEERIDPLEALGITPANPLPLYGWGEIPDQYGRRFVDDDGDAPVPPDPRLTDLPPFFDWWGPGVDR
jgi:Plasmid pRiA4b ORF-3-like protein